jgi:hypothetical protein
MWILIKTLLRSSVTVYPLVTNSLWPPSLIHYLLYSFPPTFILELILFIPLPNLFTAHSLIHSFALQFFVHSLSHSLTYLLHQSLLSSFINSFRNLFILDVSHIRSLLLQTALSKWVLPHHTARQQSACSYQLFNNIRQHFNYSGHYAVSFMRVLNLHVTANISAPNNLLKRYESWGTQPKFWTTVTSSASGHDESNAQTIYRYSHFVFELFL